MYYKSTVLWKLYYVRRKPVLRTVEIIRNDGVQTREKERTETWNRWIGRRCGELISLLVLFELKCMGLRLRWLDRHMMARPYPSNSNNSSACPSLLNKLWSWLDSQPDGFARRIEHKDLLIFPPNHSFRGTATIRSTLPTYISRCAVSLFKSYRHRPFLLYIDSYE